MRSGCVIQIPCMCADYEDTAECLRPRLNCGRDFFVERKRLGGDDCEILYCEGLIKHDGVLAGTRIILAVREGAPYLQGYFSVQCPI